MRPWRTAFQAVWLQSGSKLFLPYSCLTWKLLIRKEFWLRGKDLNLRPLGYEFSSSFGQSSVQPGVQ